MSSETYGEKRYVERKEQMAEEARERMNNSFDRAYAAIAEGKYPEAVKEALKIYFSLDTGDYYVNGFGRRVYKSVDDIDSYDMQDREPPGNHDHALRPVYLAVLVNSFEDMAESYGFDMHLGSVSNPRGVLRWFRDRDDHHVGVAVWNELSDFGDRGRFTLPLASIPMHDELGKPSSVIGGYEASDVVLSSLNFLEAAATDIGILEDDEKPTWRLEEEFSESWLHGEYAERVENGQDLVTVISAGGERGVGKTVLALKLAQQFDRTDSGVTAENVTVHPEELREMYLELPKGSALILDEAEAGLSNRQAMTNANQAIRDLMNMGRVEEKYLFVIAPAADHLDKFAEQLSAVWILAESLGESWVHEYDYNPYEGNVLTPKRERLKWWDLKDDDLQGAHDSITEMKRAKLRGEGDGADSLVSKKDVRKQVSEAREKAQREQRDELLRELYESTDLNQQELANAVGLSRSRIGDIVTE